MILTISVKVQCLWKQNSKRTNPAQHTSNDQADQAKGTPYCKAINQASQVFGAASCNPINQAGQAQSDHRGQPS